MQSTIPFTSEPYVPIFEGLEKQAPGTTHVNRDDDGVMIIDDGRASSL